MEKEFEKRMEDFGEEVKVLGKKIGKKGKKFEERMEKDSGSFEKKAEKFEKTFDERAKDFGKEVEGLGKKTERKIFGTFGILWPLISSIISLIVLIVIIWFLNYLAQWNTAAFLASIAFFFESNLELFFILFLVLAYLNYFSKAFKKTFAPLNPLITAFGATVAVWIIIQMVKAAKLTLFRDNILQLAVYLEDKLIWVFVIIAVLGYLGHLTGKGKVKEEKFMAVKKEQKKDEAKDEFEKVPRLYRSGKEKILGGVCGGIAEYLKVDPVLIRLLWVAAALIWGAGIILYIIAWIIIPRNPNYEWKE